MPHESWLQLAEHLSEEKMFEECRQGWTKACLHYRLIHKPEGSGELKMKKKSHTYDNFVHRLKSLAEKSPFQPRCDKTNKLTGAPSEDSDQPGHPPSLIRVFAVRSVGS